MTATNCSCMHYVGQILVAVGVTGLLFGCRPIVPPTVEACTESPELTDRASVGQRSVLPAERLVKRSLTAELPADVEHHSPSLASLSDGSLVAVWSTYSGAEEYIGSSIYFRRRDPLGNWLPLVLVRDNQPLEAAIKVDDDDELELLFAEIIGGWSGSRITSAWLSRDGAIEGRLRAVGPLLGHNIRTKPTQLRDGTWILGASNEWTFHPVFYWSTGDGHWDFVTAVNTNGRAAMHPSNVERSDGSLVAYCRDRGTDFWLWQMESPDGVCWSAPAASGFDNPGSAVEVLRLRSGAWLLAFNDSPFDRFPLGVALSDDEGRSWQTPVIVDDGGGREVSYPTLTQSPDGLIHMAYSDGRKQISHVSFSEAWVRSGGATR